jgi:hypothetical protein
MLRMAWVKVPPEHHPIFIDALPRDPRVERIKMFGGIAAKVNGHFFAGLFGRSAMRCAERGPISATTCSRCISTSSKRSNPPGRSSAADGWCSSVNTSSPRPAR